MIHIYPRVAEYPPPAPAQNRWTVDSGQKIGHWPVDKNWTADSGQRTVDSGQKNWTLDSGQKIGHWTVDKKLDIGQWTKNFVFIIFMKIYKF